MNLIKEIVHTRPVRYAYTFVKHVLLFDMIGCLKLITKNFDRNSKKINKLQRSADRKRCFIVCTGPSLTVNDVEKLSYETSFGVNGIFLCMIRHHGNLITMFAQMLRIFKISLKDIR